MKFSKFLYELVVSGILKGLEPSALASAIVDAQKTISKVYKSKDPYPEDLNHINPLALTKIIDSVRSKYILF